MQAASRKRATAKLGFHNCMINLDIAAMKDVW